MPSRRSSRLRDQSQVEAALKKFGARRGTELHDAIAHGACPRCGEALDDGYDEHLASCEPPQRDRGKRKASGPPSRPKRTLEEKMGELRAGGVVDLTDAHAVFACLGSTGNHYKVTLHDEPLQKCTCIDHRVRKRNCKHVQLIWRTLGIDEDRRQEWRGALDRSIAEHHVMWEDEGESGEESGEETRGRGAKRGDKGPSAKRKGGAGGRAKRTKTDDSSRIEHAFL